MARSVPGPVAVHGHLAPRGAFHLGGCAGEDAGLGRVDSEGYALTIRMVEGISVLGEGDVEGDVDAHRMSCVDRSAKVVGTRCPCAARPAMRSTSPRTPSRPIDDASLRTALMGVEANSNQSRSSKETELSRVS